MKTEEYYICADCLVATKKPFCNGDGKHRCGKCSIRKWEINQHAKIRFKEGIFHQVILTTTA